MLITEYMDCEPPEGVVQEIPNSNGLLHIPIKEVKSMLSKDFYKWGTENFKVQYIQRGHDMYCSSSVELVLEFMVFPFNEKDKSLTEVYRFVGANTFNTKVEQPDGDNDNYEGTALSMCIKNAVKNLGRKYGLYLNSKNPIDYVTEVKKQPTKPSTKKTISHILKTQPKSEL